MASGCGTTSSKDEGGCGSSSCGGASKQREDACCGLDEQIKDAGGSGCGSEASKAATARAKSTSCCG